MSRLTRRGALVVAALALGVTAWACTGGEGPTGVSGHPAIPSFAKAPNACGEWGCSINQCGYDPATDPRGACCLGPVEGGGSGQPKPSCEFNYCEYHPFDTQICSPNSEYCQDAYDPGCPNFCSNYPGGVGCPYYCSLYPTSSYCN